MPTTDRPLALLTMHREVPACAAVANAFDAVFWPELENKAAFLTERGAEVRTIVTASSLDFPGSLDDYPNLEVLAFTGAGYSTPETDVCLERGIAVTSVPASNYPDVADHAMGLIISVARNIGRADRLVRGKGEVQIRRQSHPSTRATPGRPPS